VQRASGMTISLTFLEAVGCGKASHQGKTVRDRHTLRRRNATNR
jgi:hypothetical protein